MILVTGATGLVGGNLMWQLLQENKTVAATCRATSNTSALKKIFSFYTGSPDEYLARIEWRRADILELESMQAAMEGVDVVYHCAAQVSLGGADANMLDTNVVGTRNVVQAALSSKIRKFCFVSSIAACGGGKPGELIDERTPWEENRQRSLYSLSKHLAEQEVWAGIKKGLQAVIVNPGVILGYSGNEAGSSRLFTIAQNGLMFYVNGGTGYVDVQDVARAMIGLVKSPVSGERFILVGKNTSTREILNGMAEGFGKQKPLFRIGSAVILPAGYLVEHAGKLLRFRPMLDRQTARTLTNRKYYSSQKIIDTLGFSFTPIEKCIREVCGFMMKERKGM